MVFAAAYIDDSFNDLGQVDTVHTTAEVDTANGWVTLSRLNMANSLLLYAESRDLTLVNGDAVETYQPSGGLMVKNSALSVNGGLKSPVSISGHSPGEYLVLEKGSREAVYYQYDGTGMMKNGSLGVSLLNNPLAMSAGAGYDFSLLDGSAVKSYSFDGGGFVLNDQLSINLEGARAVGISAGAGSGEYSVVDGLNKKMLSYVWNGSAMEKSEALSIETGLTSPRSVSRDGNLFFVADDSGVKAFNYDGSRLLANPFLSVEGLSTPLAVAVKPGGLEYAVLQYDESSRLAVSYYAFDGLEMREVPALRVSGLSGVPYDNDQLLVGKGVTAARGVSGLKLTAETELPTGTEIAWETTVDGVTWKEILNNGPAVRFDTPGTKPNYRAVLKTSDITLSPKIFSVCLSDASLAVDNMKIVNIVGPEIPGNPPLPTGQPVKIWAGYNVTFQVETRGGAELVSASIHAAGVPAINLSCEPLFPAGSDNNTWQGTFHTPVDVPRGTLLEMDVTAGKGAGQAFASYPGFAEIYASALENHLIHLTH
jgi:hypothetical protein